MATSSKRNAPKLSRIVTLGEIESELINNIIQLIYEINDEDAKKTHAEPIKLIINSLGGEVYSGLALIDVIDSSQTPVYTICHGSCMSMALPIYAAGHHRLASKNATFMYHEASYAAEGKVLHHKQELKETDRIDILCDNYLLSKTKFTQKQLTDIKNKRGEWYFDIKVATKYGLVNEVI